MERAGYSAEIVSGVASFCAAAARLKTSIAMGLQFAFPIIAMELVTEAAVGILMRVIPQINVFSVNFQLKIIVGLMMLVYLFNPIASKLYDIIDNMFLYIEEALMLLA